MLVQEDVGNQVHIGRIFSLDRKRGKITPIAQHDPARFTPGVAGFLTQDEESSGVIDVSNILGEGWFLLDVQAHYTIAGELAEGGQLLALKLPTDRSDRDDR
jgi:hypothetical protein